MATVAAVAISFQWFDQPIALLVHHSIRGSHQGAFDKLTHISDPLIPLAIISFVGLGFKALYGRSLSNLQAAVFVCSLSVILPN